MKNSCRTWVEVSLGRIAANFRAVRSLVGAGVEVCPVVKADAYRHGAIEVSRALLAEGASWLAVSSVEEGIALRNAGLASPRILVMADLVCDELAEYNLTPVIHSLDDIPKLGGLPYHLKIDSGMGRLGTRAIAANLRPEGVMTHFASAADYTRAQTDDQCRYFDAIVSALPAKPLYQHLASTIAIAYGRKEAYKNMVRPGHAIYGYVSPVRARANEAPPPNLLTVKPALSWKARILLVKDVPAGAPIGYGATYVTTRPTRIGILAAGYADGIPRSLANKGRVIAAGQFCPILGAVSMDITTIDLTNIPHLKPGDAVTLIGEAEGLVQDAHTLARAAGTISYSLLCGISARVHRIYVD
jgi:alanine racemase